MFKLWMRRKNKKYCYLNYKWEGIIEKSERARWYWESKKSEIQGREKKRK